MSKVDASDSTTAAPSRRYPKRQRITVSYYAPHDIDAILGPEPEANKTDEGSDAEMVIKKKAKRQSRGKALVPKITKPFPFMRLPPELRNEIYKIALVTPGGLYVASRLSPYRRVAYRCDPHSCRPPARGERWSLINPNPPPERLALLCFRLLRTSKLIWAEAHHVLYSQRFTFADVLAMQTFLLEIGLKTVASLRHIRLLSCASPQGVLVSAFSLLRSAESLRMLEFHCLVEKRLVSMQAWQFGPQPLRENAYLIALHIYRFLHFWLDNLFLDRKVNLDRVIDMLEIADENFRRAISLHSHGTGKDYKSLGELVRGAFRSGMKQVLKEVW